VKIKFIYNFDKVFFFLTIDYLCRYIYIHINNCISQTLYCLDIYDMIEGRIAYLIENIEFTKC